MGVKVPPRLAAALIYALYKPWCATLRMQQEHRAPTDALFAGGQSFVLGLWHNEAFTLISLKAQLRLMTIASQSRDGEYITGVLHHLGFRVVRGSSSRGGLSVLRTCVRTMRDEHLVPAITLDGPRGPRHVVKNGALYLAHHAHVPIVPVRAFCSRCLRAHSWDRFEVPLPFSKVRVVFGEPYTIEAPKLTLDVLAEERTKLQQRLTELEHHAYLA